MLNIAMMDSDKYINYGLSVYFNSRVAKVLAANNINDLTHNLRSHEVDVVVMELFSRDDDIFDCIEFIRIFPQRWPKSKLVIYTQMQNEEAMKLLAAATGQKEIVFKTEEMYKLASRVFTPAGSHLHDIGETH